MEFPSESLSLKKKICFYTVLSSGHVNLCASIGKVLLNNYADQFEIYWIVDKFWQTKIAKLDSRFKCVIFEYDNKQDETRIKKLLSQLEDFLELPLVERLTKSYDIFIDDPIEKEIDRKAEKLIKQIKPDLLLCDLFWVLPTLIACGVKYGFVASTNPSVFFIDGYPIFGSDCGVDEKEKMEEFRTKFSPCKRKVVEELYKRYEKRGLQYRKRYSIASPLSEDFPTIYTFPKELDYFSDETKKEYNLWQIDTALLKEQIPEPFELQPEFACLPEKQIIYVSLGTCFSIYTERFQKLIDILETLPYKYIVSKGPEGHKLKFPSKKFIGDNYVNQLAILQIADAVITHGGNNSQCEITYFGVPSIVIGIFGDQINNAKRVDETGFGYSIDLTTYNRETLADTLKKLLNNKEMRSKLKSASERIQKEDSIDSIGPKFLEFLNRL